MTFILIDNEAVPCECRQVRQAEEILKKSGISEEFRNNKQIKRIIPGDNQGVTIFVLRELY